MFSMTDLLQNYFAWMSIDLFIASMGGNGKQCHFTFAAVLRSAAHCDRWRHCFMDSYNLMNLYIYNCDFLSVCLLGR